MECMKHGEAWYMLSEHHATSKFTWQLSIPHTTKTDHPALQYWVMHCNVSSEAQRWNNDNEQCHVTARMRSGAMHTSHPCTRPNTRTLSQPTWSNVLNHAKRQWRITSWHKIKHMKCSRAMQITKNDHINQIHEMQHSHAYKSRKNDHISSNSPLNPCHSRRHCFQLFTRKIDKSQDSNHSTPISLTTASDWHTTRSYSPLNWLLSSEDLHNADKMHATQHQTH
jgi:hypothetical protein